MKFSSRRIVGISACLAFFSNFMGSLSVQAAWFTPSELPPLVVHSCSAPYELERAYGGPKYKYMPVPAGSYGGTAAPQAEAKKAESSPPMPMTTTSNQGFSPPPQKASADAASGRSSNDLKEGPQLNVHQTAKRPDREVREASQLYLSNDDSMSLASAQRIIYAINNFLPIYKEEVRPHEFLNYFLFKTNPIVDGDTFSVKMQAAPRLPLNAKGESDKGESLAIAVQGKGIDAKSRRPAVLTLIVDKSGSMAAEGKMSFLKEGLGILKKELKAGDVVNVVEFDHEICNAMEGFVVGRDSWQAYDQTVDELAPRGSTNLHDGLVEGYKLADKYQDQNKINRVILITDAIANTGELSEDLMASIGKFYDTKKIALSGIGLGLDFNDELLDTLTDRGKGAYLYIGNREALPRIFGDDFMSLLETIARDVHFQVFFPKGWHLDVFYGEEVSTEKEKVQAIHYFANTAQLFLLDLAGKTAESEAVGFQIQYTDPLSGQAKVQSTSVPLAQIRQAGRENIAKARMLMAFTQLMEDTAIPGSRPYGNWSGKFSASAGDVADKKKCAQTMEEMKAQTAIYSDAETGYVLDLANKYCSRF